MEIKKSTRPQTLQHMLSYSLILMILCSPMALTNAEPAEELDIVSEYENTDKIFQEVNEISIIQHKIMAVRYRMDSKLAYIIAESVYENCKEFNKDPDMILSIVAVESYFNPRAKSPANARGLMQVMPLWTKEFNINVEDLYDIDTNIKSGIKILTTYEKMYKKYDLVLTAYNRGPMAVNKDLQENKNPCTGYSRAIIEIHNKLKNITINNPLYLADNR